MKYKALLVVLFLTTPMFAFAQVTSVQDFLGRFGTFLSDTILPFLFALALLFFIFNVVKYFIIEINNSEAKEKARNFALYSIAAFVFILVLWGIVNLLVSGLGFGRSQPICPDSVPAWVCLGSDPNDQAPEE